MALLMTRMSLHREPDRCKDRQLILQLAPHLTDAVHCYDASHRRGTCGLRAELLAVPFPVLFAPATTETLTVHLQDCMCATTAFQRHICVGSDFHELQQAVLVTVAQIVL